MTDMAVRTPRLGASTLQTMFISNLLKLPTSTSRPSLPYCPVRHVSCHAFIPAPFRHPPLSTGTPSRLSRTSPTPPITAPLTPAQPLSAAVPRSSPITATPVTAAAPSPPLQTRTSDTLTPQSTTPCLTNPDEGSSATRPRGHRHTDESRRKIGLANRGNVPWNKGRPHSEETKRKIAENTRRAMLRPELRQMLRQRARGRRHSEQTKLKIRHTTRRVRGAARVNKVRKQPVPFQIEPHVVETINESIHEQVDSKYMKEDEKYTVQAKRVMSSEAKEKLSRRIKQMWSDPGYRLRVSTGVEARLKRIEEEKEVEAVNSSTLHTTTSRPKSEPVSVGEFMEDIVGSGTTQGNLDGESDGEDEIQPASVFSSKSRSGRKRGRPAKRQKKTSSPDQNAYENADDTALQEEKADNTVNDEVDNSSNGKSKREILLSASMLNGWTKEDLGIFGSHGDGLIPGFEGTAQSVGTSVLPVAQPFQSDVGGLGNEFAEGRFEVSQSFAHGDPANGTGFEEPDAFLQSDQGGSSEDGHGFTDITFPREVGASSSGVTGVGSELGGNAIGSVPIEDGVHFKDEDREVGLIEVTGQDVFPDARNMGSPFGPLRAENGGDEDSSGPLSSGKFLDGDHISGFGEDGLQLRGAGEDDGNSFGDAFNTLGDL